MSLEGDVISERFVEGLNASKGTMIIDSTLCLENGRMLDRAGEGGVDLGFKPLSCPENMS
jgi:hypothetical protein